MINEDVMTFVIVGFINVLRGLLMWEILIQAPLVTIIDPERA